MGAMQDRYDAEEKCHRKADRENPPLLRCPRERSDQTGEQTQQRGDDVGPTDVFRKVLPGRRHEATIARYFFARRSRASLRTSCASFSGTGWYVAGSIEYVPRPVVIDRRVVA